MGMWLQLVQERDAFSFLWTWVGKRGDLQVAGSHLGTMRRANLRANNSRGKQKDQSESLIISLVSGSLNWNLLLIKTLIYLKKLLIQIVNTHPLHSCITFLKSASAKGYRHKTTVCPHSLLYWHLFHLAMHCLGQPSLIWNCEIHMLWKDRNFEIDRVKKKIIGPRRSHLC